MPPEAKRVFRGVIFDIYQWEQKLFDGTTTIFEKAKRPDTVVIVPVMEDGRLIILEQEQPGRPPFVSFPSGRVDPEEDPVDAAKRELLEETGHAPGEELVLWYAIQPTSKIDWAIYVFVARGCKRVSEQDLDGGEKISVNFMDFETLADTLEKEYEFNDEEIALRFLRAKNDPSKMADLKKLLGLT
jgi:8-oxo-dGTP pyrophosphatase MutT (NUDIX family)